MSLDQTMDRVLARRGEVEARLSEAGGMAPDELAALSRELSELRPVCEQIEFVRSLEADRDTDPERHRALLDKLIGTGRPVVLAPNKIDTMPKEKLLPLIASWQEAADFAAIIPVSAMKGDGVGGLISTIIDRLPEGPAYFPKDQLTDVTERFVVSELIREQVFRYLDKELPYAIAVEIEEFEEGPTVRILARIWVERDSQKGIVIGKGGSMLRRIGTSARIEVEKLLQTKVYLKITVGVSREWTTRKRSVERLGKFGENQS